MRSLWRRLQTAPLITRWPLKWAIFFLVTFFVLYPRPMLFVRNVRHYRQLNALPEPTGTELAEMSERFATAMTEQGIRRDDLPAVLEAVNRFVDEEIPYAFDWEVWGVVDYVPTLDEALAAGREDCDGQAIVAAALLRQRGIKAHIVGDPRHIWVTTPIGETMGSMGKPVFAATDEGTDIHWLSLIDLGPLAVGARLFPLGRELIILLTLWVLLLPARPAWLLSLLALLLLLDALLVLRLAGVNPMTPSHLGIWWALLHLPLVVYVLGRPAGRRS